MFAPSVVLKSRSPGIGSNMSGVAANGTAA